MALLRPAWMQATGGDSAIEYSAALDRRVLQAVFSREGVKDKIGGSLHVRQRGAGANMSVDILAGECAIFGDDVSDQGAYQCTSTATENRTIPSPPGSGSRTHRVVARVRDKMHNGIWTGYDWVIEVLQDTGSGTPAIPNSAISLGRVTVSSGQSSVTNAHITDDRGPWSVGTPALQGNFGAMYVGFQMNDPTRPLRWSVNPDGWVHLSGWVRWNDINTTVAANEARTFGGTPLSDPAVRPPAIRDFVGATAYGPLHYSVHPDGTLKFRPTVAITLQAGANPVWWSFDGCFYRL